MQYAVLNRLLLACYMEARHVSCALCLRAFPLAHGQVYSLRLEAVLAELALLRVQCGVDYSLTLVGGPGQPLEVITSGEGGRAGRESGWQQ